MVGDVDGRPVIGDGSELLSIDTSLPEGDGDWLASVDGATPTSARAHVNWTHKRSGVDVLSVRPDQVNGRPKLILYLTVDRSAAPLCVARVGVVEYRPDAHGDERERWAHDVRGAIRIDRSAFVRTGILRAEFSIVADVLEEHPKFDLTVPVDVSGRFQWDPAKSEALTEVCTASDFVAAREAEDSLRSKADATGTLDLQFSGDGWQDYKKESDFTLWLHSDVPEIAARIPARVAEMGRKLSFERGHCVVDAVPIGVHYAIYASNRTGYLLDDGDGPTRAGSSVKFELMWLAWPDELQHGPGGMIRRCSGRLLDDEGRVLDASSLVAWVFNPIAGDPLTRWYPQAWNATAPPRRGADGTFQFDLGVMHGRPEPGELVLGLRDERRGMPWVLRTKLTPEQDFASVLFGDVRMERTKPVAAGVVVDGNGAPIPDAFVWVESDGPCLEKGQSGFPLTVPTGCIRGSADAQGRFELFGISEAVALRCFAVAGGEGHLTAAYQLHDQHPMPVAKGSSGLRVVLSE